MKIKKPHFDKGLCAICDLCGQPPAISLTCIHAVCYSCIRDTVPEHSLTLACQLCAQLSIIPPEVWLGCSSCNEQEVTAAGNCLNCSYSNFFPSVQYKMNVHSEIIQKSVTANGSPAETIFTKPNACSVHSDQLYSLYCSTCNQSVCPSCPHSHSHVPLALADSRIPQTQQQQQQYPGQLQDQLRSKISELRERLQKVYQATEKVHESSVQASSQIQECFAHVANVLQERRNKLSEQLAHTTEAQQKQLFDERRELEAVLSDLEENAKLLETGSNRDEIVRNVVRKLELLAETQRSYHSSPVKENNPSSEPNNANVIELFCFQPNYLQTVDELISKLGSLLRSSEIASDISIQGEGLRFCCVGRKTAVTMYMRNDNGELIDVDFMHITGDVTSHYGRVIDKLSAEDLGRGICSLSYTLRREGMYKLSVQVYGKEVAGSPFQLRCIGEQFFNSSDSCSVHSKYRRIPGTKSAGSSSRRSFTPIDDDLVLKVGRHGRGKASFINPQDIACMADGSVVITDSNTQCVQVFTQEGDNRLVFGIRGRGAGQLQRPVGVIVDAQNRILVADYDTKWVTIFDSAGHYVNRIGIGKLLGPKGILINRLGQIIVIDNKASSVLIFQPSGKLVRKFGTRGTQPHNLAGPHFVALDAQDRLFITDFHNHSVKVFSMNGDFLFSFGSNGEGNGQFNAPTGIAIDAEQHVLVADWGNNRIQIFDTDGSFLSFVNSCGEGIYGPQGIAVAPGNHVLVADSGNHCYKVYRYLM